MAGWTGRGKDRVNWDGVVSINGEPTEAKDLTTRKYVDDEIPSKAWSLTANQTGITGDKAGSFDVNTTGNLFATAFRGVLSMDTNDFLDYDKTNNDWRFWIGGTEEYSLSATDFDLKSNNLTTTGLIKGALDADTNKIINVVDPTANQEAATKKYVDDNAGGAPEGTAVLSTGEGGGTKFLREDGDGTCSWQAGGATSPAGNSGNIQFNDGGAFGGENSLHWDKTNNRLGVGTNAPVSQLQVESTTVNDLISAIANGTYAKIGFFSYRNFSSTHCLFNAKAARGSKASPSYLLNGDAMFSIRTGDAKELPANNCAKIEMFADGNHSSSNYPGMIKFATTASGATDTTARLTIKQDGKVGIGTQTPATSAKVDITSTNGALLLPRMTTAQRDALTAVNGMLIYDSTLNQTQTYENGAWRQI